MGKLLSKNQIINFFELEKKRQKKAKFKFIDAERKIKNSNSIWHLSFYCEYDHKCTSSLGNIRKKITCDQCTNPTTYLSREGHLKIFNKVHNNYYRYDKFKYEGIKKDIQIFCPNHNDYFFQSYESHVSGRRCGVCFGSNPKTGKEIIELVQIHSKGFLKAVNIDKTREYKQKDNYEVQCNLHHWHPVHSKKISKITRGIKCHYCNCSKYELVAYHALHKLGIEFEIEYFVKDKNKFFWYDIALYDKKNKLTFIEIDGEQHSADQRQFPGPFHKNISFNKIKLQDELKDEYAKKNNITLHRISFQEDIFIKIQEIINNNNFKKSKKKNLDFPINLIQDGEARAKNIHQMYKEGSSYSEIRKKHNVKDSYISEIITGEKFKELFLYLYPNNENPHLRRKRVKHLKLSKNEERFLDDKLGKRIEFASVAREFSKLYRHMSRGQISAYAKKKKFTSPRNIELSKSDIKFMKKLRSDGFSFQYIAEKLNKRGIAITRPTVQTKLS